jgi:hypothetical protein
MAEINLLKTPGSERNIFQDLSSWLVKILVVLALAVIGYYGYVFFKVKATTKEIGEIQQDIEKNKVEALSLPGRDEFLLRQSQLKDFAALTGAHIYYSKLIPALAKVTYKLANYSGINITTQGKISMQATVPSLADLDKFLQVFDDSEVSKNFYNVRVGGFSQIEVSEGKAYIFTVQMDYNPAILAAN